MADLVREIEKNDLPKLRDLMTLVFGDPGWARVERLGGMTNHSYKVTREDGQEYLARIPGEGTEELISRADERKSTELACRLGIDTELLWFGDDGRKVMRFVKDPQETTLEAMRREENLTQAAAIFRRLHTCGEDTGVRFEVFEMADLYERIIREAGVALYPDWEATRAEVMAIKAEVDSAGEQPRVPCHNDSLVGNWVIGGDGRLWLVDWEYSGMNEPMWDLACLSIEHDYQEEHDGRLLEVYLGRVATAGELRRFVAAKLYVDFLWTLWGLTRVPFDGEFMQEYADGRYARLEFNIAAYRAIA